MRTPIRTNISPTVFVRSFNDARCLSAFSVNTITFSSALTSTLSSTVAKRLVTVAVAVAVAVAVTLDLRRGLPREIGETKASEVWSRHSKHASATTSMSCMDSSGQTTGLQEEL